MSQSKCSLFSLLSVRYPDPEDRISHRVISDISVLLKETTLTISDSIETGSPVETAHFLNPRFNKSGAYSFCPVLLFVCLFDLEKKRTFKVAI